MNIEEFRKARSKLGADMLLSISAAVEQFHRETGLSPRSVYVNTEEVLRIGDPAPRYVVTGVDVEVPI